ncbi:hypothetical protein B0H63DRAFT_16839 [Podospora didyma]|uniref:Uncharacterized protein n=1 Tax=Podospora didyma TaxID=330526 RepID=A0AAE0U7G0_9PEZI|nr:hypothetical protein B0H63DRAFT_16839 [Podospora didyma]
MEAPLRGRVFIKPKNFARLAQSVERETLNLKVVGSTPTSGSIPGGEFVSLFLAIWLLKSCFRGIVDPCQLCTGE